MPEPLLPEVVLGEHPAYSLPQDLGGVAGVELLGNSLLETAWIPAGEGGGEGEGEEWGGVGRKRGGEERG